MKTSRYRFEFDSDSAKRDIRERHFGTLAYLMQSGYDRVLERHKGLNILRRHIGSKGIIFSSLRATENGDTQVIDIRWRFYCSDEEASIHLERINNSYSQVAQ